MRRAKITMPCRKAFKNNKILKLPMSLTGTCSQSLSVLLIIFTCQTCGKCSFFAWTQSDKLNICRSFAELNQLYPIWYLKFLSLRHHRFGIFNKTISADITNDTGKRTHKRCTAPLCFYQKVIIIGTWVKPQAITLGTKCSAQAGGGGGGGGEPWGPRGGSPGDQVLGPRGGKSPGDQVLRPRGGELGGPSQSINQSINVI